MASSLPTDPQERKTHPITSGCLDYFPDALAAVAHASWVGNEQHHAGEPLHWDKSKSTDEADCLVRHLIQRGTLDTDGVRHTAKVAWRALALLQRELESEQQSIRPKPVTDNLYTAIPPTCHHVGCNSSAERKGESSLLGSQMFSLYCARHGYLC